VNTNIYLKCDFTRITYISVLQCILDIWDQRGQEAEVMVSLLAREWAGIMMAEIQICN